VSSIDILPIIGFLYTILICIDLIPLIKKKNKKALFLSIPVYLLTLIVNVLEGFDIDFPPINAMITQIITSIFPNIMR